VTASVTRPSDGPSAAQWAEAHERLIATLVDLIRIPTINPPEPVAP
jgi:hypothetical protein